MFVSLIGCKDIKIFSNRQIFPTFFIKKVYARTFEELRGNVKIVAGIKPIGSFFVKIATKPAKL